MTPKEMKLINEELFKQLQNTSAELYKEASDAVSAYTRSKIAEGEHMAKFRKAFIEAVDKMNKEKK